MPRSSGTALLALPTLVAGVAARGAGHPRAVQAPHTLEALAAGWSAGRAEPLCQPRGPRGEYLGPLPGAAYCQWPTLARNLGVGMVSGHRDDMSGLTEITWDRTLPDTAAVSRLADSLGAALTARGLHARSCPGDGHRWESAALGVQFLRLPPRAGAAPHVLVFATTLPGALPELTCPHAGATTRTAPVAPLLHDTAAWTASSAAVRSALRRTTSPR